MRNLRFVSVLRKEGLPSPFFAADKTCDDKFMVEDD